MVAVEHLVQTVRDQADACRQLGSPLYAALLERCADDIRGGGPAARVLAGHEDDPGSAALALRLMGGVHRLVLEGAAPAVAAYYPSVGGHPDPEAAWRAVRDLFDDHADRLRPLLESAPQTNEVGRSSALVGGLLHVVRAAPLPLRLVEIGTSAGLNLRADHFWYSHTDMERSWGPRDSPVRLTGSWAGMLPPVDEGLRIVSREGSDIAPVDPTTADGRLRLLSYVWPDQTDRFARLQAAIEVARRVSVDVEQRDAVSAVRRVEPVNGHWTVVWHSVMWQYLSAGDQEAVSERLAELGAAATPSAPLAHLFFEPTQRRPDAEYEFLVVLQTWPGGARRILGTGVAHGIPTTWSAAG